MGGESESFWICQIKLVPGISFWRPGFIEPQGSGLEGVKNGDIDFITGPVFSNLLQSALDKIPVP